MATATTRRTVGPADHGRRMSLDDFIEADFRDGWLYELARGVIDVTEVPGINHGRVVMRVGDLFSRYNAVRPGVIDYRAAGSDCRLRLPGMQSDRHPDQAIYLTAPPNDERIWTRWVPHLVVEVVSQGGEDRDYVEKREEYLRAGVMEYWIVDPMTRKMTVLSRLGDTWEEIVLAPDAVHRTSLLPGLEVRPADLLGPDPVGQP